MTGGMSAECAKFRLLWAEQFEKSAYLGAMTRCAGRHSANKRASPFCRNLAYFATNETLKWRSV
jgi:hypothetical protein